eukprot:CAMPEP_0179435804 /NCGR_PEP_ID=MMETSP0799-20121207/19856_1 /TAXON_ID=46947 /ORGANISM="Geminigera cryophila, Strain CCMP2564" /LENGTH=107 /DNA_ID=CAMNT_0021215425 /DNA_START=378 /DNA_END=701 /DNA_ORIENTATION=+
MAPYSRVDKEQRGMAANSSRMPTAHEATRDTAKSLSAHAPGGHFMRTGRPEAKAGWFMTASPYTSSARKLRKKGKLLRSFAWRPPARSMRLTGVAGIMLAANLAEHR